MKPKQIFLLSFLAFCLLLLSSNVQAKAVSLSLSPVKQRESDYSSGLTRLTQATQNNVVVTYDVATTNTRFVRLINGQTLSLRGLTNEEKASHFLKEYGDLFGIKNVSEELKIESVYVDQYGATHLNYQQIYKGLPVYAGILRVHLNADNNLTAANGVFVPDITLSTTPIISAETAAESAIQIALREAIHNLGGHTTDHFSDQTSQNMSFPIDESVLTVHGNELLVYRAGLGQGIVGANHLAYAIEVRGPNVRQFVFIDAHKGDLIEQWDGIQGGLDRKLYDPTLVPANLKWSEGDAFPTGDTDWNNELTAAEDSYNFFENAFGYTSYDNVDATMITVNDDPAIDCPNANWNGTSANYCTGVSADDVVAHEWGHAYTEYTHGLIYAWQPGALNESYSDIWGETVDLINGYLDGDEDLSLRTACSSSDRWRMGEDASAFGGAIRDMWDPTCDGDPGKLTDTEYRCSPADSGGVHSNSGVPNHAYALLVDGGTYNGQTISGISFTKAAHIYWQAQTVYQTLVTDFADHADALEQSCTDLVGINLEGLSTGAPVGSSGEIITSADCTELSKVITAVELRTEPTQCYFEPMLIPTALACGATESANQTYLEDFEASSSSLPAGWSVGTRNEAGTFTPREWEVDSSLPDGRAGNGVFAIDPVIGDCAGNNEDGVIQLFSPSIDTTGMANLFLSFDHYVSSELTWDGGNLSVRVNGGGWNLITSSDMVMNGYNGTMAGSPLSGQSAFTGANGGSVEGSWGTTTVDLSAYASPGDDIEIVWEFGTDECNGVLGWWVDDVRIHECGTCGNVALDGAETCDDGNYADGDGCSSSCTVETDYSCTAPSAPMTASITDGSFENGAPPSSAWTDNFPDEDTIINSCNGPCGGGSASDGSWWAKFRSTQSGYYQLRNISQVINIPEGAQTINFDFRAQACIFDLAEFSFQIGWSPKYRVVKGDSECGAGSYSNVSVDVTGYADDQDHLLIFDSIAGMSGPSRDGFHVDNVTLTSITPSECTCTGVTAPTFDSIAESGTSDVDLTWSGGTGDSDVWRSSNEPYFTPGADCSTPGAYACTAAATSPHTDSGATGDVANNYFYVIQNSNACGVAPSTGRKGEFDFTIVPGTP